MTGLETLTMIESLCFDSVDYTEDHPSEQPSRSDYTMCIIMLSLCSAFQRFVRFWFTTVAPNKGGHISFLLNVIDGASHLERRMLQLVNVHENFEWQRKEADTQRGKIMEETIDFCFI